MNYIVHFFDAHEHLRRSVRLESRTDDEAIGQAALLAHPNVLEVWQGDRCVWRFEPLEFRHAS